MDKEQENKRDTLRRENTHDAAGQAGNNPEELTV